MEKKGDPVGPGIHRYHDAHGPLQRSVHPVDPVKRRWDDGSQAGPSEARPTQRRVRPAAQPADRTSAVSVTSA